MRSKNKKMFLFIGIVLMIIIIVGCIFFLQNKDGIVELNLPQIEEKVDNQENFILVVSKTSCTYCQAYLPKLDKIAKKENFVAYYVEIDKFSDEEDEEFNRLFSYISGTPTTLFIEEGEEKITANRINGNVNEEKIKSKLRLYGYID